MTSLLVMTRLINVFGHYRRRPKPWRRS